jgi:cell wall-associated NlpC family hydrolase
VTTGAAGAPEGAIERLLASAGKGPFAQRIDRLSARLLGRPYVVGPLGGGPGEPETLRASLAGFDCVTFVETALALAWARTPRAFRRRLRELRYRSGRIGWATRNHYMTGWARENEARGRVVDLTRGPGTVLRRRTLTLVPGLPPRQARFRCFPKRLVPRLEERLATGDVALFASTRRNLDVFHAGLLVRRDGELRLRHATRSRGAVVEEPLSAFLAAQRTSGLIVLRPRERP